MSTQPEALLVANVLEGYDMWGDRGAAELRRLFELAHERHSEIYGLRLQVRNLKALNQELLEACKAALSDDQPYIEKCKAAITKAQGEQA